MTSNVRKGNDFENECKRWLESNGYLVQKAQRTMKFIGKGRFVSGSNDFFGLFDLVAKKGSVTRWIQCKYGSKNIYAKKKELMAFVKNYTNNYEIAEVWFRAKYDSAITIYIVTADKMEKIKE